MTPVGKHGAQTCFSNEVHTTRSASANCDLNQDNAVSALDLQALASAIPRADSSSLYDINRDGSVNALDLQLEAIVVPGRVSCP